MNLSAFHGIIAYPVTPFHQHDGSVDVTMLNRLIDRLVAEGSHGIAPLGSTGESAYLGDEEWDRVAEASIKRVAKRLPVIVGISDLTTRNAVRRAKFAEAAGADAVMVLPVSYWKLGEAEIFRHYAAIADAIRLPIMVYNNPATSGIDMQPDLIVKLAREIDNVAMIKESTGDIQRMHRIAQLSDGRVPFFNGSNTLALEAFAAGAAGWCTAAPNLAPAWPARLYDACRQGDLERARTVFYRLLPYLQFLMKHGLPTAVKAGLALRDLPVGLPRLPLAPLADPAALRQLRDLLDALDLDPEAAA
ncbi:dihydrodipicolinate synthase family protein [Burkholderia alba]|uniref:dihydrodipicolinate synthase family protein n=1 Tax=Burkholderia alba TaxID=2683677 RepID=UPI002B0597E7|nr:dihydrodipicolinate synthase family protein [Burkholderia alba]